MRPSTMVMVEGPWTGRAGSASRWPAWTMMVSAAARDAGDEKQEEGKQAGEHGPNPPEKEAASMRQSAAP